LVQRHALAISLALGPQPLCPDLGGAAFRGTVPVVPAALKLGTGAVLSFLQTLAPVLIALAALGAAAVGTVAASFAQTFGPVAAGALLKTGAVTISLPAVELSVPVAPVAPVSAVMAGGTGARIG
jgi:hypothetical protein